VASPMNESNRILVFARPGHFRESLVAVLMTLPQSELFLLNSLKRGETEVLSPDLDTLVLADPDGLTRENAASLQSIKDRYPGIRCVALVDNIQQSRAARDLSMDTVLPRGASAGELLATIKRPL
jgi:hypothetical protein